MLIPFVLKSSKEPIDHLLLMKVKYQYGMVRGGSAAGVSVQWRSRMQLN